MAPLVVVHQIRSKTLGVAVCVNIGDIEVYSLNFALFAVYALFVTVYFRLFSSYFIISSLKILVFLKLLLSNCLRCICFLPVLTRFLYLYQILEISTRVMLFFAKVLCKKDRYSPRLLFFL